MAVTLPPELVDLMQRAYSAEKAAAFAYQGHAGSVRQHADKAAIRQVELDEWNHRREVLALMNEYGIAISKYYEMRFHLIGKLISFSCYVIGWFMPYYFAGRLESGNVCEYFRMKQLFNGIGIHRHDQVLYDMGIKEKEHEDYFLSKAAAGRCLPVFERFFRWGKNRSFNNVDLEHKYPVDQSDPYCRK